MKCFSSSSELYASSQTYYICDVFIYDIIDTGAKNSLHCKTVTIFIGGIDNSQFLVDDQLHGLYCVCEPQGPLGCVSHNSLPDVSKISSYGLHPVTPLVQLNSQPS